MTKRYLKNTLSTLLALGLGSCASEDFWDTFDRTADGPISFTVGVEASPSPVQRAMTRSASGTYSMQGDTKVLLKVDGKWTKITENSGEIGKTAICTVSGDALLFDKDNTLYWDDFGAGDPDNATNTGNGLKILGVAVDGKPEVPTVDNWESLSWTVATNGSNVLDKDILVSKESTYKFSEKSSAKQLTFSHPLSKITINLIAGEGFPTDGVGSSTKRFAKDPVVTLKAKDSNYALTTGTINIKAGTATATATAAAVVAGTTSTSDNKITVIKQALVYPGTPLGTSDDDIIAVLNADDNIYYIKAGEIRQKMAEGDAHKVNNQVEYKTLPGYNYIINITVNKTGLYTTATVTDWNKVESGEVLPLINIDTQFGDEGKGTNPPAEFNSFALWRSKNIDKAYVHESTPSGTLSSSTKWTFNTPLYWPDHNTHFHLRGIYPAATTVKEDTTDKTQSVEVSNGAYSTSTSPSNLMIGMPEFATETKCANHNLDMSTNGICATEGNINLNFRYVMSQVEVNLSSVNDNTAANYVDLTNAKVELVNVGNSGKILLKDRSVVITDDGLQTFELPYVSSTTSYHGTIIPQSLLTSENKNKVQFKITVYSATENSKVEDVYYADVAPIKVKKAGSTDEATATNAWESGVHYVYNLKITKTQITATASLTDWTTKEATEDVWF